MQVPFSDRFSEQFQQILLFANFEARELGHNFVGSEMLLLGIILEKSSIAHELLVRYGLTYRGVKTEIKKIIGSGSGFSGELVASPRARRILQNTASKADELNSSIIMPEHLLYCILFENDGVGGRILEISGVNKNKLIAELNRYFVEQQISPMSEDEQLTHARTILLDIASECAETINDSNNLLLMARVLKGLMKGLNDD